MFISTTVGYPEAPTSGMKVAGIKLSLWSLIQFMYHVCGLFAIRTDQQFQSLTISIVFVKVICTDWISSNVKKLCV